VQHYQQMIGLDKIKYIHQNLSACFSACVSHCASYLSRNYTEHTRKISFGKKCE